MDITVTAKPIKVFISHSAQDLAFVQPFVELLASIGLNDESMFCSSIAGYNVPLDYNIFDYLKEQFQNYDLRVIFVLSDNYYNSAACLNEMGAAWVLQYRYTSILLPGFHFSEIKGVIDQMRISIKLDSDEFELKPRLNELRNTLISELGLKSTVSSQNIWESQRDKFIKRINSTDIYWQEIRKLQDNCRPLAEWIPPLKKLIDANPASYDAMYMLGTISAEVNDMDNAIKYLTMTVRLSKDSLLRDKATKQLRKLGYHI